jgi:hypothetical protein
MIGEAVEGIARLHAALESEGNISSTFTTRIMIAIGGSHWMLADTAAALRIAQQRVEVAQARHLIASQGWLYMLLSFLHYQRNDLAAAASCCRALVEHPAGVPPMALGHTYLALALIRQAAAEGDAQPWVEKAYALALQTGIAPLLRSRPKSSCRTRRPQE